MMLNINEKKEAIDINMKTTKYICWMSLKFYIIAT